MKNKLRKAKDLSDTDMALAIAYMRIEKEREAHSFCEIERAWGLGIACDIVYGMLDTKNLGIIDWIDVENVVNRGNCLNCGHSRYELNIAPTPARAELVCAFFKMVRNRVHEEHTCSKYTAKTAEGTGVTAVRGWINDDHSKTCIDQDKIEEQENDNQTND